MNYPESILPNSRNNKPFPIDKLPPAAHSLTRRIEGKLSDKAEVVGGRLRLDPDCLGEIVGMSVNLLGGHFLPEYSPILQKGKGKDPWDGFSDIAIADYSGCYEDTGYDYVFYRMDLLHGAAYPNVYKFNNKGTYKAYQTFLEQKVYPQFTDGIEVPISVTLTLEHAPTNLNYWHFVVKTSLTDDAKLLKRDGSWRDMIFKHLLLTVYCREATETLTTDGAIPVELYEKQE